MRRDLTFWLLLGFWAVLMVLSIIVPAMTAAKDFGLTRGFNRIELFMEFQIAGLVVALVLWFVARRQQSALKRWLGRVPGVLALLGILGIVVLIYWINQPPAMPGDSPVEPERPVAAPAAPLEPTAPAADN
ncbi:hypothetical protein [Pseudooceanicola sp.]|uniref:hypothetical protein n=1 Tax=Pseudooceanicola sp. TaxID=1914328 RepID=UPI00260EC662|nr:hypothetical protein [Pseudooceanicola sp.]MDF1856015.1 hypothetical protein [Pseudooceanicola sp.]